MIPCLLNTFDSSVSSNQVCFIYYLTLYDKYICLRNFESIINSFKISACDTNLNDLVEWNVCLEVYYLIYLLAM